MALKGKKSTITEEQKKARGAALVRMFYGFLGIIVSSVAIVACIAYKGPFYMIAGFLFLMLISIVFIITGNSLYKS